MFALFFFPAGKYNFGYIDSSAYTGPLSYTPVDNSKGDWRFTADGYVPEYLDGRA